MGKYDITFSGEFMDKSLEREFSHYDIKYYSRLIGPIALIFGTIYMLFIVADYFAIERSLFTVILIIRLLFLMVSIIIYFAIKKINDYSNLAYLITAYEILAVVSFILIIFQYESIGIISCFSVMAITLAVYITPNRLINTQIISIVFNLFFFIFSAYRIENLNPVMLFEIIMYDMIFIIFGNIIAYMTNFYRRKQFVDNRDFIRLSVTDSLTGIYNRNKFDQELCRSVGYCNRYDKSLSLIIFDIDDFKKVNDNYGHLFGDTVLQSITSLIKKAIRSTDIFARWGGDEFAILLPDTDINEAIEITERIRVYLRKNRFDRVENVTCSFGLVSLQKNENAESLLQRADKLLYSAKEQGKNAILHEAV